MYSVRGDGIVIYQDVSPTESRKASEPKLTLKDNAAGTLEISLPPGNAGYDALCLMTSELIVNKDGEDIWHGRIISEDKDFWNNRRLSCEGELAYLNDTLQPPHKYAEGITVFGFLDAVLTEHNKRYNEDEERYKFHIDKSLIYNENETLPEIVTDYESTLECINQNVTEKFECHIIVERIDGIKYLKFIKDESSFSENTQVIRFGDNLLDFTRSWDLSDLATVVIPRGKKLETEADEDSDELDKYVNLGEIPLTDVVAKSEFGYYLRQGGQVRKIIEDGKYRYIYEYPEGAKLVHEIDGDDNSDLVYEYFNEIDENTGKDKLQYEVVTENGINYIYLDEEKTIRVNVSISSADKKIIEFLENGEIVAKIETDDKYCTVYLRDETKEFYSLKDTYGHVEQVIDFSDAEDSITLLKATKDYIKEHKFDGMTLDVSAVDLHYLSDSKEPVKMLDKMRCISYPHGMNTLFTVTELSIQLDKPDSAKYTLEKTMRMGARQTAISDSMNAVEAEVESAHSTILTRAKQNADKIIREKTNGFVNLITDTTGGRHSQALVISSSQDWTRSQHFWVWNVNGLGHYTEYGSDEERPDKENDEPDRLDFDGYKLDVGITMDGAIVANRITVGHMSADRVRTGVLMSEDGNVIWSLNKDGNYDINEQGEYVPVTKGPYVYVPEADKYVKAGSMTIRKGSIALGTSTGSFDGAFCVDDSGTMHAENGTIGGFEITASDIHNDKMTLDGNGVHYYLKKSGSTRDEVGYMGTSYWAVNNKETSNKLISMNLDYGSAAISWGYQENRNGTYRVKLMYTAKSFINDAGFTYEPDHLYVESKLDFLEDVDLQNNKAYNFWIDPNTGGVKGEDGGINGRLCLITPDAINDDGTLNKSKIQIATVQNGFIIR